MLWWVKRLITLRKTFRAFGRGSFRLLRPDNTKVLAFVREYEDERMLVVANLSRFVQYVQLDLKDYAGCIPEEALGRTRFPRVSDQPYLLTIGPHGFMWFALPLPEPASESPRESTGAGQPQLPLLRGSGPLANWFRPARLEEVEGLLPDYLRRNGLLSNRASVSSCEITHVAPIRLGETEVWFLIVEVEPRDGSSQTISLGLTFVPEGELEQLLEPLHLAGFAQIPGSEPGVICDALAVPACCRGLLRGILAGRSRQVENGEIDAVPLFGVSAIDTAEAAGLSLTLHRNQRDDTSVSFGESYLLKTFRRIEEGVNPDLEIGRFLNQQSNYHGSAPVLGYIEYRRRGEAPITLGVLHSYVSNQGTAWQFTLDQLSQYFERVAALPREEDAPSLSGVSNEAAKSDGTHELPMRELIGGYIDSAALLGRRTAELHRALAPGRTSPEFEPQPIGRLYQRSLYQSMRNLTGRLCGRLSRIDHSIGESARPLAQRIVASQELLLHRFRAVLDPTLGGQRVRCHGDYHLGQLLFTGKDFVITDFAGDDTRSIGERRVKRSPLVDVACMVRSFDYVVQSVLLGIADPRGRPPGVIRPEDRAALEPWAHRWYEYVAREFVGAYVEDMKPTELLPGTTLGIFNLLELLLLEKALLEIDLELSEPPGLGRDSPAGGDPIART